MFASKKIDFLGIKISVLTKDELTEKILEFALTGKHRIITYLNAHCVNIAFTDKEYRKILNLSDIVHADGISIIWASKFLGKLLPERVNIFEFSERLFDSIIKKNIGIYFLGSKKAVVCKAVENLRKKLPPIRILGLSHGYFHERKDREIISKINSLRPNILIVGMGVPKQEKWVYKYLNELDVNLCWIAGSAMFDNLSGTLKNPPKWIAHIGFQWLYRLYQEPRRLWQRYLIGNLIFIYRIFEYKIKSLKC